MYFMISAHRNPFFQERVQSGYIAIFIRRHNASNFNMKKERNEICKAILPLKKGGLYGNLPKRYGLKYAYVPGVFKK
jgi:hypothetical protein